MDDVQLISSESKSESNSSVGSEKSQISSATSVFHDIDLCELIMTHLQQEDWRISLVSQTVKLAWSNCTTADFKIWKFLNSKLLIDLIGVFRDAKRDAEYLEYCLYGDEDQYNYDCDRYEVFLV